MCASRTSWLLTTKLLVLSQHTWGTAPHPHPRCRLDLDLHLFCGAAPISAKFAITSTPYPRAYELLPAVVAALLAVPQLETLGVPHAGGRASLEAVHYHLQLLEQSLARRTPLVRVEPFELAALEW